MGDFYYKTKMLKKLDEVLAAVAALDQKVDQLLERDTTMSTELDALGEKVTKMTTVVDGAVATINDVAQFIRDHADDPVAMAQYANDLDAKADTLAAAIAAVPPVTPPTP